MTHWEYGWLTLSPDDDKEWIFKKFDGSAIPNIFEYNSVEFALYDLGKKSWELISHIHDGGSWFGQEFVFKREYASHKAEPGEFLR
tara:strand:- start:181 stop:438 length:258 start_codon:yes stop_codon:yes gene_type:complete